MTATMIILLNDQALEFADINGKSLGRFGCLQAEAIFADVNSLNTEAKRQQRTQAYFEQITKPDEVKISAENIAGFERKPTV